MTENKSVWKAVLGASFLLMLISILLFLYAQSFSPSAVFPQNTDLWNKILTGYLVIFSIAMIGALVLAPKVVRSLATANYWKAFGLKFIPSFILSATVLILIKALLKGTHTINIAGAIAYMPIGVLLVHCFVVSQIEEILFGGLIFTSIEMKYGQSSANWISAGLFAIWHFAKTGGSLVVMATYLPLRLIFNEVRTNGYPYLNKLSPTLFGATPRTQQSNAGMHFAWNMFVLAFIQPFA